MSRSFHTLEEGMKITLYLMFLYKPFAFPTSCSLQLHRRWKGPASSRDPGLKPPPPNIDDGRGGAEAAAREEERVVGQRSAE